MSNEENIINMSRDDFLSKVFDYENKKDWKYQNDTPCLIDISDDSCAPCQAILPTITELSKTFSGRVIFYKVDSRTEDRLAQELGVVNLPTLVFCPVDEKPVVLQGAVSREKMVETIESVLLKEAKPD